MPLDGSAGTCGWMNGCLWGRRMEVHGMLVVGWVVNE